MHGLAQPACELPLVSLITSTNGTASTDPIILAAWTSTPTDRPTCELLLYPLTTSTDRN